MALIRIAAYLIDCAIILLYIAAITAISIFFSREDLESAFTISDKIRGHAIAFFTLTLPVWFYFAAQESGSNRASFGKRLLRIRVGTRAGQKSSFTSIAFRNGLKFLPWEVAHIAIWYVPERPFIDPMPAINLAMCIGALFAATVYILSMFVGSGRTPYDYIARTFVTRR
jgi:uncharacterized RDD family membrane protein YckC